MLGIADIEKLDIITINCNTIDTQAADRTNKCNINKANCQCSRCEQHYKNVMQKADRPKKCHRNTDSISKSNNKYKPVATDNEKSIINYFLPGLNQDNNEKASAEIK